MAAFAISFCQRHCVSLCKGTKAAKSCAFKKARKVKGEGKPTFSTRSFPLSLRPSPLPCGDRGNPPDPLCNHPKLCSFASAPKNAVHFLYGAALHRPGERPWTPYAVLCGTELRFLRLSAGFCFGTRHTVSEFTVSGIRRLWLGAFGRSGLFRCQSRSFRPVLLPPLQSCFAKDTAFFSAKAQKLKNSAKQNSWIVCRFSPWR